MGFTRLCYQLQPSASARNEATRLAATSRYVSLTFQCSIFSPSSDALTNGSIKLGEGMVIPRTRDLGLAVSCAKRGTKNSFLNEGSRLLATKPVDICGHAGRGAVAPWIVSDQLWELVEPLLPRRERCLRYPSRKRSPDRQALHGILFLLRTGIAWQHLPAEFAFGSGVTCWRRLDSRRHPPRALLGLACCLVCFRGLGNVAFG
jgi:transposase